METEISGEISDNPFQYTGRENDGTGLYYYRARYYDADVGRFVSEDPIRFAGGDVNFYAYVGNNPVNMIDPFGLDRYAPCEGYNCALKWICKKYVDYGCGGEKEIICCQAEKDECLQEYADDPDVERKWAECFRKYQECMSKVKKQ